MIQDGARVQQSRVGGESPSKNLFTPCTHANKRAHRQKPSMARARRVTHFKNARTRQEQTCQLRSGLIHSQARLQQRAKARTQGKARPQSGRSHPVRPHHATSLQEERPHDDEASQASDARIPHQAAQTQRTHSFGTEVNEKMRARAVNTPCHPQAGPGHQQRPQHSGPLHPSLSASQSCHHTQSRYAAQGPAGVKQDAHVARRRKHTASDARAHLEQAAQV